MSRFRFVHASDLHLDTPFVGVSARDERLAEKLREASLLAWDRLVDLCIKRDARFLVLSGDIYDGSERGLRAQLRFLRGLERLHERGISTFIVHGNHDPLEGWSAIRNWPDSVKVFGSAQVGVEEVSHQGHVIAQVYGISYAKSSTTDNLALRFHRQAGAGVHIGVLHCNVGSVGEHAPYSPCTLDELIQRKMDYWALGHIHRRSILNSGTPWVVYPGNLQGRSPKPSEQGPKGCVIVECDSSQILSVEFEETDVLRFVSAELDISECQEIPDLERAILRMGDELRTTHSGRDLIVRVELKGRGIISKELKRVGAIADLLRQLRDECDRLTPVLYWDKISDTSRSETDWSLIRERGDLLAQVVSTFERFNKDPYQKNVFIERQLELLKRGELGRIVQNSGALDSDELIKEALQIAADYLDPEATL